MTDKHVPQPGLGTSGHEGDTCVESVARALEAGYRHVDTAQMYGNEAEVGEGLERADVDREDVFLATKVHPDNLAPDDVIATTEASLDELGVERVDLLYVHWPTGAYEPEETLPALDEARERGWTRHVGVSNFTVDLLEEARGILESPIVAHQVEMHPFLQQEELVSYGREHGIRTVGYSPIAKATVADEPVLQEIAEKHDATPVQVTLAWHFQRESVVPIPKGTGDHIEENLEAREIDLDDDLERIAELDRGERLVDPDHAAWNR